MSARVLPWAKILSPSPTMRTPVPTVQARSGSACPATWLRAGLLPRSGTAGPRNTARPRLKPTVFTLARLLDIDRHARLLRVETGPWLSTKRIHLTCTPLVSNQLAFSMPRRIRRAAVWSILSRPGMHRCVPASRRRRDSSIICDQCTRAALTFEAFELPSRNPSHSASADGFRLAVAACRNRPVVVLRSSSSRRWIDQLQPAHLGQAVSALLTRPG